MTIYKIKFKRTKESEWENGIRIENFYDDIIINSKGFLVESVLYKIDKLECDFCIDLTSILKD